MKQFLLLLTPLLFIGCADKKDQLHVLFYSEYIDPEVVSDFETQFDCEVVMDLIEDPDTLISKIAGGGGAGYDIITCDHRSLVLFADRGWLAPLRKETIPNLKHLDPRFGESEINPDFEYAIPYYWGTTGILIRESEGESFEETWGLYFDPEKQPGPFYILEDLRSSIGAALRYLGHSVNTVDPNVLSEAGDLLIEAKKRAIGFEVSLLAKNRILTKEAKMAYVYSTEAAKVLIVDPESRYFIPQEGGMIWVDMLSISARAQNPELAESFLNFLNDPEINGRNTNWNRTATPNLAAKQFLDPEFLANPAIFPPDDVLDRVEYDQDVGEATRLFDELWTRIKSK